MTEPFSTESDNTRASGPEPSSPQEPGVRGGDADRLDPPGEGSGGLPGAGADGETAAREDLRSALGERSEDAGREGDGDVSGA